jgi:hypothetical protein
MCDLLYFLLTLYATELFTAYYIGRIGVVDTKGRAPKWYTPEPQYLPNPKRAFYYSLAVAYASSPFLVAT